MKKVFVFLLAFSSIFSSNLLAQKQSKVEMSIQLLVPDILAERMLDTEPFFTWVKGINESFEKQLEEVVGNHEGLLLINLKKDKKPEFSLSFRPPIDDAQRSKILSEVQKLGTHNTKFGEYTFFIRGTVNKGPTRKGDNFYPPVMFPREMRMAEFGAMDLQQKCDFLKAMVDEEILPVLSMFQRDVDPKFAGVQALGFLVQEKDFMGQNTSNFIDSNRMYWRALMEMSKGNQLVPFTRICMHISNEEWDIAANYMKVIGLFSEKGSVPEYYAAEVKDLLNALIEHINAEVMEGIKLHDKGEFKQASKKYKSIHSITSKSAFLNYEMYLTEVSALGPTKSLPKDTVRRAWLRYRDDIYGANPLYTSMANASSADEGYELMCRAIIKDLFKESDQTRRDLLRYADLAVELEDYAFAAHMYWWLFLHLGNEAYEGRVMLHEFLYALNELGEVEAMKNFKGDFEEEFRKIDIRRQNIKKSDTMYQAFEK